MSQYLKVFAQERGATALYPTGTRFDPLDRVCWRILEELDNNGGRAPGVQATVQITTGPDAESKTAHYQQIVGPGFALEFNRPTGALTGGHEIGRVTIPFKKLMLFDDLKYVRLFSYCGNKQPWSDELKEEFLSIYRFPFLERAAYIHEYALMETTRLDPDKLPIYFELSDRDARAIGYRKHHVARQVMGEFADWLAVNAWRKMRTQGGDAAEPRIVNSEVVFRRRSPQ